MLNHFINHCAGIDVETLESLTNKGLIKRAQKETSSETLTIELIAESTAENLKVKVNEETVIIPKEGIIKSTCTCPSQEICRHILIACFWLAKQKTLEINESNEEFLQEDSPVSNEFFLITTSLEIISKWAGKNLFYQGVEFLSQENPEVTFLSSNIWLINFLKPNFQVRVFPDAEFDGISCFCKSNSPCKHKIAAILALRKHFQIEDVIDLDEFRKEKIKNQPPTRSREEILKTTKNLLTECVYIGISHLSESFYERFVNLSVSANAVNLPKLSRNLKSLADGISLTLKRDARADETIWLQIAAKSFAFCSALEIKHTVGSEGEFRSNFEEIGNLNLYGIGAYQWKTMSGFLGLTVIFWEEKQKKFYTWTDARSEVSDPSFKPNFRFFQEIGWTGNKLVSELSESHFNLQNVKANQSFRLSGSAKTKNFILGKTVPSQLNFGDFEFNDWNLFLQKIKNNLEIGLAAKSIKEEFYILKPLCMGECIFDETEQTLVWQIIDKNKNKLNLKLPFNSFNEQAIKLIEILDYKPFTDNQIAWNKTQNRLDGILVKTAISNNNVFVQPISLFFSGPNNENQINHLNLSKEATEKNSVKEKNSPNPTKTDDTVFSVTDDFSVISNTKPGNLITSLLDELNVIAQRGTLSLNFEKKRELNGFLIKFQDCGLEIFNQSLNRFINAKPEETASYLLQLIYLGQLYFQAEQKTKIG